MPRPPMTGPGDGSVGRRWWLRLEGLIPPPVGALAGRPGVGPDRRRGCRGWAGQRCRAQCSSVAVGDHQVLGRAREGDDPAVVQPVMEGADQHQIGQFGQPAVLPMHEVVRVQSPGGPAAGHHTTTIAVLQRPTQPAADRRVSRPAPITWPWRSNHT